LISKLLRGGFAFWFAFSQILVGMSAAYAQNTLVDVEPPLIEHRIVTNVDANSRQSFFATVVDDGELDSVNLFYRFQDDPTYNTVLMQRVSFSSTFIVHIPTDNASGRNIEYYIQAIDTAGNRTVRGYAFNPLLREINTPEGGVKPSPAQQSPSMFEAIGERKNVIFIVLGALAVGALATTLSTNGSDKGGGCPNGVCTITINVGQP